MRSTPRILLRVTLLILTLAASVAIADGDDKVINGARAAARSEQTEKSGQESRAAQTGPRGAHQSLVYGDNHTFFVAAPPGWVLDNHSGLVDGVDTVLYPRGSSWKDSAAVMYAHVTTRAPGDTLDSFIADDISAFRGPSSKLQIKDGSSIATEHGRFAVVRYFSGDSFGNREAVAYLAEKKVIVAIALTARTQGAFERSLPAFDQLVQSYHFISDNPKNETGKFDLILLIAEDQAHAPAGEKYDDAGAVYLSKQHAKSMDGCVALVPSGHVPLADILVRIAARGQVEMIMARPKSKWSECLADEHPITGNI
jgi:hypothetical protein